LGSVVKREPRPTGTKGGAPGNVVPRDASYKWMVVRALELSELLVAKEKRGRYLTLYPAFTT
jgi:hypothetical protein